MARKIEIVSGLEVYDAQISFPAQNNLLCCVPCQQVNVVFQNVHNTALEITNISLTYDASLTVSIISINGNAPLYPVIVGSGATFTVKLELCRGTGALSPYWKFFFTTREHGIEDFYYVPMECVTIDDMTSIDTVNFVDVIPNTTVTQSGSITNTSLDGFSYTIDLNACGGVSGTNLTGAISPGQTIGFTISWSPTTYPQILSCLGTVSVNENVNDCNTKLTIEGNTVSYDCDASENGICCLNVKLITDGNYLDEIDALCDTQDVINISSILDKKQIVYDLKYVNPLINGVKIYFNPCLFSTTGSDFDSFLLTSPPTQPTSGWMISYNTSLLTGNPYTMNLFGAGGFPNTQRNFVAKFTALDPALGLFRITLDFYMVADYDDPVNGLLFDNYAKFVKSNENYSATLSNTNPSVYLNDKQLLSYFFIFDQYVQPGGLKKAITHSLNYTSRFYNRGLYNNVAEFAVPQFALYRNSNLVSDFSTLAPTQVVFNIFVPSNYGPCEKIVLYLVKAGNQDNSVDFLTGTDTSRAAIDNDSSIGTVLNNHFITPSTFGLISGFTYQATCHVDTNLTPPNNYRIFAVVYGGDGITVNTFYSGEFKITSTPEYDCDCSPDFESYWDNYYRTIPGNDYRPVGKERILHGLKLTAGNFANCLTNWSLDELVPDWRKAIKTVNVRIYKRVIGYPSANETTFFQYGQYTSTRNSAYPQGWQNGIGLYVADYGPDEMIVRTGSIRVPWENIPFVGQVWRANNNSYMQKTNYTFAAPFAVAANNVVQSWIDEEVFYEYEFVFDLSSYFTTPFIFSVCKAFRASAIDFENDNSGFPDKIINAYFEGFDPNTNAWFPLGANFNPLVYPLVRITWEANEQGNFHIFYENAPFGMTTIQESNAQASFNGFTQFWQAPLIDSQDIEYTLVAPGIYRASVVLNSLELVNDSYLFCGYWNTYTENCNFLNNHQRIGRPEWGPGISMATPQATNALLLSFTAVPLNSVLSVVSTNLALNLPSTTTSAVYTFFYIFTTPLTRDIDVWFGVSTPPLLPPLFTIPAGVSVGSIVFNMPVPAFAWQQGEWCLKFGAGSNYTGNGSFQIQLGTCS